MTVNRTGFVAVALVLATAPIAFAGTPPRGSHGQETDAPQGAPPTVRIASRRRRHRRPSDPPGAATARRRTRARRRGRHITPGSERAVSTRPSTVMITALATGNTCTTRP